MIWAVLLFVRFTSVAPAMFIPYNYSHKAIAEFFKWDAAAAKKIAADSLEECAILCSLREKCAFFHYRDGMKSHLLMVKEGIPMPDNIETDVKRYHRFDMATGDDEPICVSIKDSSKGAIHVDAAFYQPKGHRFIIFSDSLMFGLKDLSRQGGEPDLCVEWTEHYDFILKGLKNKVKNAFTVPSANGEYIIHVVDVDGRHNQYREFPSWPRYQANSMYQQNISIAKYYVGYTLPADPAAEAMMTSEGFLLQSRALEVFPCGILSSLPLFANHGSWAAPNDVTACAYRIADGGSTEVYYVNVTGNDVRFYKTPYTGTDFVTTEVMPTAGYQGLVYISQTLAVFQQGNFDSRKRPQTIHGHFLYGHA